MKKSVLIISLLMLSKLSIFSQQTWPQIQLINGDTICLLSINQIKKINNIYDTKNEYHELSDSLIKLIDTCNFINNKKDILIKSCKKEIYYQKEIIGKQEEIISNDNLIYIQQKKKIKKLNVQRVILTSLSISLILLNFLK